jgi:hypothetical protein
MAFNWFISLAPNSFNTWESLEQKFHEYFYNNETELRLSHLTGIKQKQGESVADYVRRFRDTRNKCYSLTIGERDLAELDFTGLIPSIKDRMEGHDFSDMNHVLQCAMAHENRAKEAKTYGWFKETSSKDKPAVNCIGDESVSDDEDGYV